MEPTATTRTNASMISSWVTAVRCIFTCPPLAFAFTILLAFCVHNAIAIRDARHAAQVNRAILVRIEAHIDALIAAEQPQQKEKPCATDPVIAAAP